MGIVHRTVRPDEIEYVIHQFALRAREALQDGAYMVEELPDGWKGVIITLESDYTFVGVGASVVEEGEITCFPED